MDVNFNLPTIITTDGKIDDIIALHILLPLLQNKRLLIVVGEHSDVNSKCECLYSAFASMFQDYHFNVKFMRGTPGTGNYPSWCSLQDGQSVPYPENCEHEAIRSFIRGSCRNSCNVIALKPPRDLLNAFKKDRKLFSNCDLYMSSSFKLSKLIMECENVCTSATTQQYKDNFWTVHHLSSHCINSLVLFLEHGFERAILFEPHHVFIAHHSKDDHRIAEVQNRPYPPIDAAKLSWEEDPWAWHPYAVSLEKYTESQDSLKLSINSSVQRISKALHSFRESGGSNLILDSTGLAVFMTCRCNTFELVYAHIDFNTANNYYYQLTPGFCIDTKLRIIRTCGTTGYADNATYMLKSVIDSINDYLHFE